MAAAAVVVMGMSIGCATEAPMRVAVFEADVSPPIGSALAYGTTERVLDPLIARGIVLIGDGEPIVLCAVDWIGIANETCDVFREALAEAAGTEPERVSVHAIHQHDTPLGDLTAEALLAEHGLAGEMIDMDFARGAVTRTADAVRDAVVSARPVTHLGLGEAEVERVASNRRLLGEDGTVRLMRFSAAGGNPEAAEAPVGLIDPNVKLITLWDSDEPVVALAYYATHPQSFYRTDDANPDFPGIARAMRDQATGVPHVYFTGAAGNIAAGKWNDGSEEYRPILAQRLADGMERAWDATERAPIAAADLDWAVEPVALPVADHLDADALLDTLADEQAEIGARRSAARNLAWVRRTAAGETIDLTRLRLGRASALHMPGELFVEYQLAAQRLRPDLFVATAAYTDYGPGYIGTAIAYTEGGYETGPASRVGPGAEPILMDAMRRLLEPDADQVAAE